MGVSYTILGDELLVAAVGAYGLEDLKRLLADVVADPRRTDRTRIIVDAREAGVNPPANELRQTADLLNNVKEILQPRCAVVVSGTLHYGLGRMLSLYAELHEIDLGVFRTLDEAREWIRDAEGA